MKQNKRLKIIMLLKDNKISTKDIVNFIESYHYYGTWPEIYQGFDYALFTHDIFILSLRKKK